ncbi:MAG TPA: hypothetical protein DCQ06_04570 [Myxococcales bacterium]|nr:hypothetical protein [Myxococcales bacterium]
MVSSGLVDPRFRLIERACLDPPLRWWYLGPRAWPRRRQMARVEELELIEAQSAEIAEAYLGVDPGRLAEQLAGAHSAAMGERMADRYANIGSRMLADPVPTKLDTDLIDRLASAGFDRDRLRSIRVHRGLKAHAAADALSARAFAVGDNDIFFGRGEYDPASRIGRAVIAHEVAHIAPPRSPGLPSSFGTGATTPVLNERKRGDEDSAQTEAHEEQAREAEAMVYAQEDDAGGGGSALTAPGMIDQKPAAPPAAPINETQLESAVLGIIRKLEQSDIERRGRF